MIIDAFMFFNELDILEGRLEYLYDRVDLFVIAESNITHSGRAKPYNFLDNRDRYQKYIDKIRYVQVDLDPNDFAVNQTVDQTDYSSAHWQIENLQRNRLQSVLAEYDADATVMISDLDEIPNWASVEMAISNSIPVTTLQQRVFYYNFNQYQLAPWSGTVVTKNYIVSQVGVQYFRDNRFHFSQIANGGWHLSYWGDSSRIRTKLESFAHQEYNREEYTDLTVIEKRIEAGEDLFGRDNPFIPIAKEEIDPDIYRIFSKYLVRVNKLNIL